MTGLQRAQGARRARAIRAGAIADPFDDRPGATVGKLQIALANEDMAATRVVADCAVRFERDRTTPAESHRGRGHLPREEGGRLALRRLRWRALRHRVERYDHETADENLVRTRTS